MADIKEILETHKEEYQMLSFAFVNSVSTLIYTEFLRRMKRIEFPVPCVHVPRIAAVEELCNRRSPLMIRLSVELFETMQFHPKFDKIPQNFKDAIYDTNCSKVLNGYLIPIIEKRLPEVIKHKFKLDTDQQTFIEDNTIDLFNRIFGSDPQVNYVTSETVLQMVMQLSKPIEGPKELYMDSDCIISIDNDNAIAPIMIDLSIIENINIFNAISFVTNTVVESVNDSKYIKTNPNNKVMVLH